MYTDILCVYVDTSNPKVIYMCVHTHMEYIQTCICIQKHAYTHIYDPIQFSQPLVFYLYI